MGRYIRKCKAIGKIAVMEVASAHQVGVMTRARALAIAAATARVPKRKNIESQQELQYSSSYGPLRNRRRLLVTPDNRNSPASSGSSGRTITSSGCASPYSDHVVASRSSSNGSSELVSESSFMRSVVADLKGEGLEFESSTCSGCGERRETTPLSDLREESDDLEFMERPSVKNSRHRSREDKVPSAEEIEEFFSAAEKDEQKRFTEKYNYDIVKDVPLEGRYEWVQLKP